VSARRRLERRIGKELELKQLNEQTHGLGCDWCRGLEGRGELTSHLLLHGFGVAVVGCHECGQRWEVELAPKGPSEMVVSFTPLPSLAPTGAVLN